MVNPSKQVFFNFFIIFFQKKIFDSLPLAAASLIPLGRSIRRWSTSNMMSMRCENLATSSRMWTTNLQHLDKLQSLKFALARKNQVSMFPNGFCGFWWKMLLLGCIYINMIYVHVKKGRLPKSFHPLPSALGRSLWWRCSRPPMPMWVAAVAFVVHKAVVAIGSLRWNKVMWCLGSIKARLGDTWTAKNATFSASNLMNFFLGTSLRLYSVVVLEVSISLWSCVGMWFVNLILVGIQGGEKLVHWITPVTAGKRVILQIEMSRV